MTRKDYKIIAQAIADSREKYGSTMEVAKLIGVLGSRLKEDNPRFNPDKFWQACGL